MTYTLYVPAPGALHDIRPGSAIVGERNGDWIETHYEGGGASNVQTYEQRINQAAGRRMARYPTSAMRAWPADQLMPVGTVAYSDALRHWHVATIEDGDALRRWLGGEEVAPGPSDALYENEGARRFADLPAREQARIAAMRLPPAALGAEIVAAIGRMLAE